MRIIGIRNIKKERKMDYMKELRPKLETLTMIGIFLEKVPMTTMSSQVQEKFNNLITKSIDNIDSLMDKMHRQNNVSDDFSDEIRFD